MNELSPFDTPTSAATRFGIEIVAWVAGPWAAADLAGSWVAAIPTLLVLVALPAVFNTPGDKQVTGIATPGPIRIVIEMLLAVVAVRAAWVVWPAEAGLFVTGLALTMVVTGFPRYRWLAAGAPPQR